jgi:tryptophan-rich sensory protein
MRRFAVIWTAILVLAAVLGVVATAVFDQQRRTNDGVRNFICFFEQTVVESPKQSVSDKHKAIIFFNQATTNLGVPNCTLIVKKGK